MRHLPAWRRRAFRRGPFQIQRIAPGLVEGEKARDTGLGGLGLIDHAHLDEGLLVPMHEHRNDEILSYLRRGSMVHRDTSGATAELRPGLLMMMNAGSGISHEESVPRGDVDMLQIFIRPEAEDLPPRLQFHTFPDPDSVDAWRLVAGPSGMRAALEVRQRVAFFDARLSRGVRLPAPGQDGFDQCFLYVMSGNVEVNDRGVAAGEALAWDSGETHEVMGLDERSDLALFLIDTTAPASRAGTLSG